MKLNRMTAFLAALTLCAALTACGDTPASSTAAESSAAESTTAETATVTSETATAAAETTTAQSETTTVPASETETQAQTTVTEQQARGFTDAELCVMAQFYYGSRKNYIPEHIEAEGEENGIVTIHLYNETADHTATLEWYYIDRVTGKGTDLMENPVDLTEPPAEVWEPVVPQRSQIKGDARCALLYLGYIDTDIAEYMQKNVAYREMTVDDDYAWLAGLPAQNFAETPDGQELYLVIPRDSEANVKVRIYDFASDSVSAPIYSSYSGAPFLLRCNVSEIASDVRISVTDNAGEHPAFSPYISGEDGSPKTDAGEELVTILNAP